MTSPPPVPSSTMFFEHGVRVAASVTIQRTAADLFAVWKQFTQLPRFIDDLKSVERIGPDRTRWVVTGPASHEFTWEARIINEQPDTVIAWRTEPEPAVPHAGSVIFTPLPFNRGTEVRAVVNYVPPAGKVSETLAKWLGNDPQTLLRRGLYQFRQLMEAGEVATAHGQPVGANSRRHDRPGEEARSTHADVRDLAQMESES